MTVLCKPLSVAVLLIDLLLGWISNCENADEDAHSSLILLMMPSREMTWRAAHIERQCVLRLFIEPIEWPGKKYRGVIYGHGIRDSCFTAGSPDQNTFVFVFWVFCVLCFTGCILLYWHSWWEYFCVYSESADNAAIWRFTLSVIDAMEYPWLVPQLCSLRRAKVTLIVRIGS